MHRRTATVLLCATLLTGAAGVAAVTPAYAADGSRLSAFTDALAGLVIDGAITQEQADTVAQTLAEAAPDRDHHERGPGLDAASESLGLTVDELRTELRAGQTLADVAAAQGVPVEDLVEALVTEGQDRLARAVTDGQLTQAQADERSASLTDRVTDFVNGVGPERGFGGPGHGHRHGFGADGPDDPAVLAPSGAAGPATASGPATAAAPAGAGPADA